MPGIKNAAGLKLSTLVERMKFDNPHSNQELRAKGSNLYVKKESANFTSVGTRQQHRQAAVSLLHNSLQTELGTTIEVTDRIFQKVIGSGNSGISVSDATRLHTLTLHAKTLSEYLGTDDIVQTFKLAKGINSLPTQQLHLGVKHSKSAPEGIATPEELLPPLAQALATGLVTLAKIKEKIPKEALSELYSALHQEMSDLPPYELSNDCDMNIWLHLAMTLGEPGRFSVKLLEKGLSTEQKLSMLEALTDQFWDLREEKKTLPEQVAVVQALTKLCFTVTTDELLSDEEVKIMHSFISDVGKNKTLRTAFVKWTDLDNNQRGQALQTLIDLHADHFDYADDKPTLKLETQHKDNPDIAGESSAKDNALTLYTGHELFLDNTSTFTTIIHELTHKLQNVWMQRLTEDRPDPGSTENIRLGFFDRNSVLNFGASNNPDLVALGLSKPERIKISFNGLRECHARIASDYAVGELAEAFESFEPSEDSDESSDESSTHVASVESSDESSTHMDPVEENGEKS